MSLAVRRLGQAPHQLQRRRLIRGMGPVQQLAGRRRRTASDLGETSPPMFDGIFQSTTIPILQQVVDFTQARHVVLAGNIANLDTPGYRVRDLPVDEFQKSLQEAIDERHKPKPQGPVSPGELARSGPPRLAEVARNTKTILYHDQSNVGLEFQVTEMVKNQLMHNTALAIMASQFRLLQAAISERV